MDHLEPAGPDGILEPFADGALRNAKASRAELLDGLGDEGGVAQLVFAEKGRGEALEVVAVGLVVQAGCGGCRT